MKTIGKYLVYVVLGIAIAVIFLQNCNSERLRDRINGNGSDTTTIVNSYHKDTTIFVAVPQPTLVSTQPFVFKDSVYIPDTSYKAVLKQFIDTLRQYLAVNNYSDTIHLDSLQWVLLNQSVYRNRLQPYNIAAKNVTKFTNTTVTINNAAKKKFQLYGGIDLMGNRKDVLNGAAVGLIGKTKGDHIYRLSYGTANSQEFISLGAYWKFGRK